MVDQPVRSPIMRIAGLIGLIAMALSFWLILGKETERFKAVLAGVNFLCWLSFTAIYPVAAVRDGIVFGGLPYSGHTRHESEPFLFWASLLVMTFLFAIFTAVAGWACFRFLGWID